MGKRWRIVLPIIGLMLFGAESYHSFRENQETRRISSKYFWWSSIQLDSDPANKRARAPIPCEDGKPNCANWDITFMWVDPGLLAKYLMLSTLPAFVVGKLAVGGLGRLGISQVSSFMCLMPVLIFVWYYFIGWLLDRWTRKWSQRNMPASD